MAMRTTSSGSCTIVSPLSENMTTMVNSSAMSVIGLMRGMKCLSYQSRPFARRGRSASGSPARKGMPR